MAKDYRGGGRSAIYMHAASNRSEGEREEDDFYATPPFATCELEKSLKKDNVILSNHIVEPAIGMGHIVGAMALNGDNFREFIGYDTVDRDAGKYPHVTFEKKSFFDVTSIPEDCDIVTNPPYKFGAEFVQHAMDLLSNDHYCCMLLKITFLEGKKRRELFDKYPPKFIYVFSQRINCAKKGDFNIESELGGQVCYAWYVWQKGFTGKTQLSWI